MKQFLLALVATAAVAVVADIVPVSPVDSATVKLLTEEQRRIMAIPTYAERLAELKADHAKPHDERTYGRDRGNRIDLRTLPVTIGKAQAYADVILDDPSVSRLHARIYRGEDGAVEIKDLGSTNGTFINGIRIPPNEKSTVQRGDEVKFGTLEYEYR